VCLCVYEMVLEVMQVPVWSSVEMPNSCFPIRRFGDDVRRGLGARARAWYSIQVVVSKTSTLSFVIKIFVVDKCLERQLKVC
jgi:hypothetical protein